MQRQEKRFKKNWSKEETDALLKFYNARQEEFKHSRRKKYAYANILKDMISAGFADSNTTILQIVVRMQTLIKCFKASKQNKRAAPCLTPFIKQMEEIFGGDSALSNANAINIGADDISEESESNITLEEYPASSPSRIKSEVYMSSPTSEPTALRDPPSPSMSPGPSTSGVSSSSKDCNPKRKMTQELYFQERLKQRDRDLKEATKRWEQWLQLEEAKAERHRQRMEMLQKLLEK